jgi:glycosyltransferase involved in cell wall biosynthesis
MAVQPKVSVVIPVFNEAKILPSAAADLRQSLDQSGWDYELLFAENGSRDATRELLVELAKQNPRVRFLNEPDPNYGRALKRGILEARGDYVICDEIDLCDASFHRQAMEILLSGRVDMVVGSKAAVGARDERPLVRRAGTLVLNSLLRLALGYDGTDTHGLKAFRREALLPVAAACLVERDLFASEFVVRAYRMGVRVQEIPVSIREKRRPSVHLFRRVPNVLGNLMRLVWVIRFGRRK